MGLYVYMSWDGQTEAEKEAQVNGVSVTDGHLGYLRESGGGLPSAIRVLVPDACAADGEVVPTPASGMRDRLGAALVAAAERYVDEPLVLPSAQKSLSDFVDLAETKERATGKPCGVAVR